MALSDKSIKALKPGPTAHRAFDGRGLYMEVSPAGGRWWRLKYRFGGKEKRLSLGVYPDVSLKEARDRREAARALLAQGVDPSVNRKATKDAAVGRQSNSFEIVTREWFGKYSGGWSESHSSRLIRLFERDIFPFVGGRAIAEITAPDLLAVMRKIEARALETAHRALGNCGQVFRYGIATGRCERDLSQDLRGALPPFKGKHFAATLEPKRLGAILAAMDAYPGTLVVASALRLAPLVFVRPGELRRAEWAQVDLDAAEWRFTASKRDVPHVVPLSTQAVAILRELYPVTGPDAGLGRYVFPGSRSALRPMSDNAVLVAMRSMEIGKDEMTGHGFRAVARTILDEVLGFRTDYIEQQLAHAVKDPNGRAYNRTRHLPERRKMMQAWADYLDALKRGDA